MKAIFFLAIVMCFHPNNAFAVKPTPKIPETKQVTACSKDNAEKVETMLNIFMVKIQRNGRTEVYFRKLWLTINRDRQLNMIRDIAINDTCFNGKASEIWFFSPNGKRVAIATKDKKLEIFLAPSKATFEKNKTEKYKEKTFSNASSTKSALPQK